MLDADRFVLTVPDRNEEAAPTGLAIRCLWFYKAFALDGAED